MENLIIEKRVWVTSDRQRGIKYDIVDNAVWEAWCSLHQRYVSQKPEKHVVQLWPDSRDTRLIKTIYIENSL